MLLALSILKWFGIIAVCNSTALAVAAFLLGRSAILVSAGVLGTIGALAWWFGAA